MKRKVYMPIFCFAVMTAVYVQYQMPTFAGALMQDFSLSAAMYSSIFSAPLIPSIALSFLAGLLADRYGVMPVVTAGAVLALGGGLLRIGGSSYASLLIAMLLMGMLPTLLNVNISKALRSLYEPEDIPKKLGLFYGCSMLGMTLGTGTSALFSGYHPAFAAGALLLGAVLALLLLAMKKTPFPVQEAAEGNPAKQAVLPVLRNKKVLCLGCILALVMAGCTALSGFLPDALNARGISSVSAGLYTTVFLAGNICSTLLLPQLSVRLGVRRTAIISMSAAALFVLLIPRVPEGLLLALVLFLTGLSANGMIPLCMSLPVRYRDIGPDCAGAACGVLNTLQMAGGVLIPTFVLVPLTGGAGGGLFAACAVLYVVILLLFLLLPEPK